MRMFIQDNRSVGAGKEVILSHGGTEISWKVTALGLKTEPVIINGEERIHLFQNKHEMLVNTYDPFEQINGYWAQLSPQKVETIFRIYQQINDTFNNSNDRNTLIFDLYTQVAALLDNHELDDVEHWVTYHSNVYINPAVFDNEYIEAVDKRTTREQTYLRDDYLRLVTLSIVLRTMIPVWGAFLDTAKSEHGTLFKEYYAFELLKFSKLAQSPAMEKLETYLKFTIAINKIDNFNSILSGISTENFPTWIMALAVVRRLCLGDVRGTEKSTTLISTIYGFAINKIRGGENGPNSATGVKPKTFENKNDPEKASSRLEGYKIKQDIPPGNIVALEDAVSDPYLVARQLEPGMPEKMVTEALKSSMPLMTSRIYDGQITIMQWLVSPVINPRGVGYLGKMSVVRLLAVAQAVLWYRGHKELAGLVTAMSLESDEEISLSGDSSRTQLSKALLEELDVLYPYKRRPSAKKKTSKLVNTGLISIATVMDLLIANTWRLTMHEKYVIELNDGKNHRRYSVPRNIRVLLAELLIGLAKAKVPTV